MTTLAANVNADAERWTLDSLPSTQYVQVDDETIEVRAMFPSSTYSLTGETLPPRIRVRRGIAGTTKASHLSGATLTPNYGLGSGEGGGAIAVTDGTTTVEDVTSLLVTGGAVTDEGGGVAGVSVPILSYTTTLTNAQIKSMPPGLEVLPAPGANKAIYPLLVFLRLQWVADYTNINVGAVLNMDHISPLEENPDSQVTALLAVGEASAAFLSPRSYAAALGTANQGDSGWSDSGYINQPLTLSLNNGGAGSLTGGDVGNSLQVTVVYTVLDFS